MNLHPAAPEEKEEASPPCPMHSRRTSKLSPAGQPGGAFSPCRFRDVLGCGSRTWRPRTRFRAVSGMILYLLLLIPLAIGTLIGVGIFAGIDYGEYRQAILNLAAIASFNNGIIWMLRVGKHASLWCVVTCGLICFGLFMLLFDLDMWEADISLVAVNAVEFAARLIVVLAIVTSQRHAEKKRGAKRRLKHRRLFRCIFSKICDNASKHPPTVFVVFDFPPRQQP